MISRTRLSACFSDVEKSAFFAVLIQETTVALPGLPNERTGDLIVLQPIIPSALVWRSSEAYIPELICLDGAHSVTSNSEHRRQQCSKAEWNACVDPVNRRLVCNLIVFFINRRH